MEGWKNTMPSNIKHIFGKYYHTFIEVFVTCIYFYSAYVNAHIAQEPTCKSFGFEFSILFYLPMLLIPFLWWRKRTALKYSGICLALSLGLIFFWPWVRLGCSAFGLEGTDEANRLKVTTVVASRITDHMHLKYPHSLQSNAEAAKEIKNLYGISNAWAVDNGVVFTFTNGHHDNILYTK